MKRVAQAGDEVAATVAGWVGGGWRRNVLAGSVGHAMRLMSVLAGLARVVRGCVGILIRLWLCGLGVGIAEWREEPGYRWKTLTVEATGRAGFTSLSPEWTGITFSNRLSDRSIARNGVVSNGSGVALGDVDGDGSCDIYLCGLDGPNVLYRNLGEFRFEEITGRAGVACDGQFSTGAVLADVDGDNDLDLLVNAIGGGTRLFLNDGKGRFTEKTDSGLARRFGSTTLALGDIDSDGDLDLYVTNYRTRSHKDESPPIQIEARMVDGRLVVSPEARFLAIGLRPGGAEIMEKGESDLLYRNEGNGRFSAVSWTKGGFRDNRGQRLQAAPTGWGLSVMCRDLDGDGLPDLYVCNDFVYWPDEIWLNQGAQYFQAMEAYAFRNTSMSSMALDVADINRDGHDDIFVLEMLRRTHADRQRQRENRVRLDMRREMPVEDPEFRPEVARNTLFVNRGDGTYAEVAQLAGVEASDWSWSAVFLDVDLDGYEDLLIANGHNHDAQDFDTLQQLARQPRRDSLEARLADLRRFPPLHQANVLFRNRGDLTFEDVSRSWGFDQLGISQAMALADLDGDGDLDVVINNLHHLATILRNDTDAPRLAIRLNGRSPNTRGIGARIRVRGGPVVQSQEIQCGGRYLAGDEAMRVFAVGSLTNVLDVEVSWRNGGRCQLREVVGNRLLEVHEPSEDPAMEPATPAVTEAPFFTDLSPRLRHRHEDAMFDDLERQPLLPRKLSALGPGVGWIDVDGDGADDLVIGGGMGGHPAVYRGSGAGRFTRIVPGGTKGVLTRDQGSVVAWAERGMRVSALVAMSNYEDELDRGPAIQRFDPANGVWAQAMEATESSVGPLAATLLDGQMVLFVGGRVVPGRYPEPATSRLYRWQDGNFELDERGTRELRHAGMVSGAVWSDLAGNGRADLVLACDWGPIRVFRVGDEGMREVTGELGLKGYTGWWNGVATGDFDGDGRMDIVASNWGRNTKYQSHRSRELAVFYGEFTGDTRTELLEAYYDPVSNQYVPWAALDVVASAIPEIGQRFTTARSYGAASVTEILGAQASAARMLTVRTLESTLFLNRGQQFQVIPLPLEAQFAPAFGVAVSDFDGDGFEDLFLSQNFFGVEPETSRYDAGRGLWLRGDGRGRFQAVPGQESGIKLYGEQRGCAVADFDTDGRVDLVIAQNHRETALYRNARGVPGLRVRFGDGDAAGIGVILRLQFNDRLGPAREVQAGSGYWSQNSLTPVLAMPTAPSELWVRWPGGRETRHPVPAGAREIVVRR